MSGRYGLEIRGAEASDAPGLCELLAACGHATPPAALAASLEALRRVGGAALLAHEWGPPSGAIVLHWIERLGAPRLALASLLLVAPDARRRGVARLLLKTGAQAARSAGCETLQLLLPPHAPGLTGFAEASGFTADGATWSRPLRKRS